MAYWILAAVLIAFGLLAALSIGAPFVVVGLAMVALGPLRARPRMFWPLFVGVVAFVCGTMLTIPLTCESTSTVGGDAFTICRSILGPTWSGPGVYNPPPEATRLGLAVGAVAAALAAAATLAWLRFRGRSGWQRLSDWRPSPNVLADWETVRAIPRSPLVRVVGVGRTATAADLTVDLLALEVREAGVVIYWRARSTREVILLSADVSIADDRATAYHVIPGGGSGNPEAWEGQSFFLPVPPAGVRLAITLTSFGPSPDRPLPANVPTDRIFGPWQFEVDIP